MTKDNNQKWAELEGCKEIVSVDKNGDGLPPDFTCPNRFFSDVVPRIKKLMNLTYSCEMRMSFDWSGLICRAGFTRITKNGEGMEYFPTGSGKSEGEAGLDAAIRAREVLDVQTRP